MLGDFVVLLVHNPPICNLDMQVRLIEELAKFVYTPLKQGTCLWEWHVAEQCHGLYSHFRGKLRLVAYIRCGWIRPVYN